MKRSSLFLLMTLGLTALTGTGSFDALAAGPQNTRVAGKSPVSRQRRSDMINSRKTGGIVVSESGVNPGISLVLDGASRDAAGNIIVSFTLRNVSDDVISSLSASSEEGVAPCYLPGLDGSDIRPKSFDMSLDSFPKEKAKRKVSPSRSARRSEQNTTLCKVRQIPAGHSVNCRMVFDRLPQSLQRMKKIRLPILVGGSTPLIFEVHNLPIKVARQ